MHDRRLNGETLTFGNQGALFMHAMTWWDHETQSIWSQPWGKAISGPLEGSALELVPASLAPWSTWLAEHPGSRVLTGRSVRDIDYPGEGSRDFFVAGVAIRDHAAAYPYDIASNEQVINDLVGDDPIAVFVDPETRSIKIYLRVPAEVDRPEGVGEVHFETEAQGRVVDMETGSVWDTERGVAVEGPLNGAFLHQVPYITAYKWAWLDFYPHSTVYGEETGD